MDPGSVMFFVFVGVVGAVSYGANSLRRAVTSWRTAAMVLGMNVSRDGVGELRLTGHREGFAVLATARLGGTGVRRGWTCRVEVDLDGRVPGSITLGSEAGWRRIQSVIAGADQQIGDPQFDAVVRIAGDPAECAALLDASARGALVRPLVEHQATLVDGRLVVERRGVMRAHHLAACIKSLAAAAATLHLDACEVATRLARNAAEDPLATVRARNLRLLVQRHRAAAETQAALERALNDADAEMRAFAASMLGTGGTAGHVSVVEDPRAEGELRAAALEAVEASLAPDELGRLVRIALESPHQALRRAAAGVVERRSLDGLEATLRQALVGAAPATAVAICRAMAAHGPDARNESVLVALLDDRLSQTRVAAAEALGHIGHLPSIAALQRATEGVLADASARQAARDAIVAIQARHGTGHGRLSIVEAPGQTGALSLAESDDDEG